MFSAAALVTLSGHSHFFICFGVGIFGVYHGASVLWCVNLLFSGPAEGKTPRSVAAGSNSPGVTSVIALLSDAPVGGAKGKPHLTVLVVVSECLMLCIFIRLFLLPPLDLFTR